MCIVNVIRITKNKNNLSGEGGEGEGRILRSMA
jgi:hypothetical protein